MSFKNAGYLMPASSIPLPIPVR